MAKKKDKLRPVYKKGRKMKKSKKKKNKLKINYTKEVFKKA